MVFILHVYKYVFEVMIFMKMPCHTGYNDMVSLQYYRQYDISWNLRFSLYENILPHSLHCYGFPIFGI